jgi:DNA-directed RNA polymerase subunit M/transcription elongation factor TFIIS
MNVRRIDPAKEKTGENATLVCQKCNPAYTAKAAKKRKKLRKKLRKERPRIILSAQPESEENFPATDGCVVV